MSTQYDIIQKDQLIFFVDEHSNKFDLVFRNLQGTLWIEMQELSPDELIQAALEMLKVASYWTEPGTVRKAFEETDVGG